MYEDKERGEDEGLKVGKSLRAKANIKKSPNKTSGDGNDLYSTLLNKTKTELDKLYNDIITEKSNRRRLKTKIKRQEQKGV